MRLPLIAVALISATPAVALDLPARKPGLWDLTMTFEGRNVPPRSTQFCVDAATDKLMNNMGSPEACPQHEVRSEGSGFVTDSVCQFGALKVTTHGIVTGSFDSAYTVKTTSKREGGPNSGETSMTIAAKWLGPCKADQKPGDMMLPGGRRINVKDMPQMAPGGAPPR